MKKNFTAPLLYDAGGDLTQSWFVYFYQNGKRQRTYASINNKKTEKERRKAAQLVISEITTRQKLTYKSKTRRTVEEYMHSKRGFWRPKTFMDHKSKVSTFFDWLAFEELNNRSLRKFFIHLMESKSRTTYNNYRTVLRQLFRESMYLMKNELEELFNGINSVKAAPTPPSIFTSQLVKLLKKQILEDFPQLWLVCQLQYYCFIRPGEIRCLKVGDVVIEESKIIVHASISKSKKTRYPVVPPCFLEELEQAIEGRHLGEYLCPSNRGTHMKIGTNEYANMHRKALRLVGLPTARYKLYSWKPTGMLHAIKNGASIKFLKEQAGHYSIDQTDSYLRSVGWRDDDNSACLFPKI